MTNEEKKAILDLMDIIDHVMCDACKDADVCDKCVWKKYLNDCRKPFEDGDPANKKDQETLDYYVTVCTNCNRLTPIANYCMWCGKKGTYLVGEAE